MNTRTHKTNTPHARRHEAAGRSHAPAQPQYEPKLCGNPPLSSTTRTAYPQPQRQRILWDFPGSEWVAISIFVICLTVLYGINRREDAARLARHQQTQVLNQNEYQAPDGFGPLLSHGGDHEQHTFAP
ncbi:MAG: hypothetical protein JJ916_10450 [Phycisphaerales bacterium]|nr:hypothetical protein [Phycisphaerales bacterium]